MVEDEMMWHYSAIRIMDGDDEYWAVCEVYGEYGHTMQVTPQGESAPALVRDLETMLYDVKKSIEELDFVEVSNETMTGALPE